MRLAQMQSLTLHLQRKPEEFDLSEKERETLGPLQMIGGEPGKFLPLDQNLKRTFRIAAKVWELKEFSLDTHGADFQDFLAAKSARNKLTHPRTYYDIQVTDHNMHCHTIAGMWAQAEFVRLFRARQSSILSGLKERDRADIQTLLQEVAKGRAPDA